MSTFTLEAFQNPYLAEGVGSVDAVVTVTAAAGEAGRVKPEDCAEVIIVDTSGSMQGDRKIQSARVAAAAAIGCIKDGVRFALVAGAGQPLVVYPRQPGIRGGGALAVSTPATRAEAQGVAGRLEAVGGTAIGTWLDCATGLFQGVPGVRHAILLTDGSNEGESAQDFQAAITRATGVFQCDCRGVGTDWMVAELRKVSDALLGTVRLVVDPAGLEADFTAVIAGAMGKAVADVGLRVWSPQGSVIQFVKQVSPEIVDLTARRAPVAGNPLAGDYPTGAWGAEARDYHISVRVPVGNVGDERLAARVSLMVDGQVAGQALVKGIWTDDTALSTKINRHVAIYTGQAELADAVAAALDARSKGDMDTATVRFGRAVQLAEQTGNDDTAKLLSRLVDVEDAATGRVRLKSQVSKADEMDLDTQSTRTARVTRP